MIHISYKEGTQKACIAGEIYRHNYTSFHGCLLFLLSLQSPEKNRDESNWGPVHTNPDIFETAYIYIFYTIRPSTRN